MKKLPFFVFCIFIISNVSAHGVVCSFDIESATYSCMSGRNNGVHDKGKNAHEYTPFSNRQNGKHSKFSFFSHDSAESTVNATRVQEVYDFRINDNAQRPNSPAYFGPFIGYNGVSWGTRKKY